MNASETIKYLYEHGHIPQREHYVTIVEEIQQLQTKKETLQSSYKYISDLEQGNLHLQDINNNLRENNVAMIDAVSEILRTCKEILKGGEECL